jgi:hypothetical protein
LHSQVENVNREEYLLQDLPHLSYDIHGDVLSHKHELESSNEEAGSSPITMISDFHKSKELVSLVMNHKDQFYVDQMSIEISNSSPQFSDL